MKRKTTRKQPEPTLVVYIKALTPLVARIIAEVIVRLIEWQLPLPHTATQ